MINLDIQHPARRDEVQRFGHTAKRVHNIPPPVPLLSSFAQVMAHREQNRPMKRRQDDWMDEDDFLGADLNQEQDLRSRLQRGPRIQGEGSKGRRVEGNGNRGMEQGVREQQQFFPGRGAGGN